MTASWNHTDEVSWPGGDDGVDARQFESDWPTFEESLRAHGYEASPPVVSRTNDVATIEDVREAHESDSENASVSENEHASPADGAVATDATEQAPDEPRAVPVGGRRGDRRASRDRRRLFRRRADSPVEDSQPILEPALAAGGDVAPEATMAFEETAETLEPVMAFDPAASDEFRNATAEDPWSVTATAPTDDGSSWHETFETVDAPPALDPADAQPEDSVALQSTDDDTDAPVLPDVGEPMDRPELSVFGDAPVLAGAAGAVFEGQSTSDPATAGESANATDSAHDDVDGSASVSPVTGEATPVADPRRGATQPQTLPDDRLPTPPPDLFTRFARRAAPVAAAESVAGTNGELPSDGGVALEDSVAVEPVPAEPETFVPWSYDAPEAPPAIEAAADDEAASADVAEPETAAGWGTPDDNHGDPAWQSAAQEGSWETAATEQPWEPNAGEAQPEEAATAEETTSDAHASVWADWETVAGEAAAAPTDTTDSSAETAEQPSNGMAVDWYEAAAIEAVGTSTGEELTNTEFVGYDASAAESATDEASAPTAAASTESTAATLDGATTTDEPTAEAVTSEATTAAATTAEATGAVDPRHEIDWDGAEATDDWPTLTAETEHPASDEEWPESTAADGDSSPRPAEVAAAAAVVTADDAWPSLSTELEPAAGTSEAAPEETPSEHDAAAAAGAAVATAATAATAEPTTTDAWPAPEAADWEAAEHDTWVAAAASPWRHSDPGDAAAAGVAVADGAALATAQAPSTDAAAPTAPDDTTHNSATAAAFTSATATSGLFSRYDTAPAETISAATAATAATATAAPDGMAATVPTTTSPRGESDLWHMVSDPNASTAAAPATKERRSFDPVTIFLTVLVAIIIVALLLGLIYTVSPLIFGVAH